jgi:hypothetical protein
MFDYHVTESGFAADIGFEKFWNEKEGCLKDVLSGTKADNQIRCNQIWAVSLPFSVLSPDKEKQVTEVVYRELYFSIYNCTDSQIILCNTQPTSPILWEFCSIRCIGFWVVLGVLYCGLCIGGCNGLCE